MPCDVRKLANVYIRHFAEIVFIRVRAGSIRVKAVASVDVPQSLVVKNLIAFRTRGRTRRPGDEYSRSGIPRSVVLLNEIIV